MSDRTADGRYRTAEATLPAFERFRSVRRFGSLDGWRAIAIVAVIWHHTMAKSFAAPVAQEGRHGVTLFFVISGFLIITLMLRSRESPAGFTLWKFWGRRMLRIFPIYYTVLLVYIVLVRFTDHSASGAAFFANLPFFATFTTNWFVHADERTIFFFSWSLATEEQFYLVWPVIEVLIPRTWVKLLLIAGLAVASRVAIGAGGFEVGISTPLRILASVSLGIMLGTALAHLLHNRASFRVIHAVLGRRGSAIGCLVLAIWVAIAWPEAGSIGEILAPISFALLIASTVVREDNDLAPLLRWRPMVWVGTISYGMYMMHMLAVNVVRRAEPMLHLDSSVVLFCGSVAVAVAMASVSFVFFEQPFLGLKDRLFQDRPSIRR